MDKEKTPFLRVCLFLTCCCLFLFGCTGDSNEASDNEVEREPYELHTLDVEYEEFHKTVGWLSSDTILIHLGNTSGHQLISFNIFTGESVVLYEGNSYFLSIEIHTSMDQVLIQEVNAFESNLIVIERDGKTVESTPIDYSGYVNLDWNPANQNLVFISYYVYNPEEETDTIEVYVWDTEENTLDRKTINSLSPKWYSANVYLYINEFEDNQLYIGDMREENNDLLINQEVSDFFLYEDTFIGIVESDILDNQVHLFHEYPLLVSEHVLTIPKVTMNNYPVKPHLTQSVRNGKVYAVLPSYSFSLEEDLGEYVLADLNFAEETIDELVELPEDAPILVCPDERFLLYGWRYESLIDLETNEIIPLLNDTT